MKNNKDLQQTINVNVAQGGEKESKPTSLKIAEFIKKIIDDIEYTSFKTMLKLFTNLTVICASCIMVFFTWHIAKDQNLTNDIINKLLQTDEVENMNLRIRDIVTPKINDNLIKYMYKLKADRAAIFELHNGKENLTHMPFRFADMSFEKINDQNKEISFVSDHFQNIKLSSYTIPYYLSDNNYFIGTIDEAKQIDSMFAHLMQKDKGNYLCAIILRSNGLDIGFLAFFYDNDNLPTESKGEIKETLKKASDVFSSLLDLSIQKQKYVDENGKWKTNDNEVGELYQN